ncbi:MAG: hypothetical protein LOY01_01585 [Brachybacterium paraconglomeratum]|nr:hypothetical protein [Brachybacterium paraconglomeratum]
MRSILVLLAAAGILIGGTLAIRSLAPSAGSDAMELDTEGGGTTETPTVEEEAEVGSDESAGCANHTRSGSIRRSQRVARSRSVCWKGPAAMTKAVTKAMPRAQIEVRRWIQPWARVRRRTCMREESSPATGDIRESATIGRPLEVRGEGAPQPQRYTPRMAEYAVIRL